jgi:hypothetical protein
VLSKASVAPNGVGLVIRIWKSSYGFRNDEVYESGVLVWECWHPRL